MQDETNTRRHWLTTVFECFEEARDMAHYHDLIRESGIMELSYRIRRSVRSERLSKRYMRRDTDYAWRSPIDDPELNRDVNNFTDLLGAYVSGRDRERHRANVQEIIGRYLPGYALSADRPASALISQRPLIQQGDGRESIRASAVPLVEGSIPTPSPYDPGNPTEEMLSENVADPQPPEEQHTAEAQQEMEAQEHAEAQERSRLEQLEELRSKKEAIERGLDRSR